MELVIIRGLPGSGKSTLARTEYPDHYHYEPDHLFCDTQGRYLYDKQIWDDALKWVWKMVDFALAKGKDVVVSDVFATEEEVKPYRVLAAYHKANLMIVTCTNTFENEHHVPLTILHRMEEAFEDIRA